MDIKLFMHNEVGHEKLNVQLKHSQFSTINHATGTGKSFIILKYLYNNRDKRILYLTPTYHIFTQLVKNHMKTLGINLKDFVKFDNIIYRNLMGMDMEKLAEEYDIIICDEYHRCGAKKWSKKIKELKNIIKTKYPDKKMIGLTATPKRYLDNERNMTNELFDGKCASTIELADAIIKGLLPAPIYISTLLDVSDKLDNIRKRIDEDVFYSCDKKKYEDILSDTEKVINNIVQQEDIFSKYIKEDNGKYIAFNRSINSIKENKGKIKKIFGNKNINFFEIHSRNSNEKNEKILEEFKNSKEGINVLCVVDILNEGIHVSGIDGILMFRKTSSPIIYFQQLGRLLSYSGRDDNLVVWDLVGNINHHKAIKELYKDVNERARKLIDEEPENKERYEKILERFKIIDNTNYILDTIENLNKNLSKENIIRQRIKTAVDILTGTIIPDDFNEKLAAHIDLFKYYNYVTLDMHKRLKEKKVILPVELDISSSVFESKLLGFPCYREKKYEEDKNAISFLENYFKVNKRVPRVTSADEKEVLLSKKIVDQSYKFSGNLLNKLRQIVKKDKTLSAYDLVFYGVDIKKSLYDDFVKVLEQNINNPNLISKNIISFLRKNSFNSEYDFKFYLYKLSSFVGLNTEGLSKKKNIKLSLIDFAKAHEGKLPSYDSNDQDEVRLFLELNSLSQKVKDKYKNMILSEIFTIYDVEDEEIIKEKVEEIAQRLLDFIEEKHRYPKYSVKEDEKLYFQYRYFYDYIVKYGYKNKLDELLKLKQNEDKVERANELIEELIKFIRVNNGDLPSNLVSNAKEVKLARAYSKYKKYFTEEQKTLLNNEIMLSKGASISFIDLFIDFIMRNNRYPLSNSENEEERTLHNRYIRNKDKLSINDNKRIKIALKKANEKRIMKNTFSELYKKGVFK